MPQINIPENLFQEIQRVINKSSSADDFILQAVRDKLTFVEHKQEFFKLTEHAKSALAEKCLSEAGILSDFERFRNNING